MSHVAVSNLAYAHPGGDLLFDRVSFRVAPGRHAGLIGTNGVGKSTLLRILAGELQAAEGHVAHGGRAAYMPQDVETGDGTVRELLLSVAPERVREIGAAMLRAERELAAGDDDAGVRLGEAIGTWSELGGYELEGQWDSACRRITRAGLDEVGDRPAATLSGGERKRLVLALLFASDAQVLLLDEPDNFLDVPAKRELEALIRATRKTILVISHDRELLTAACDAIVTLEGSGAWVHGGSYATYPEARAHRQKLMGDRLARWREEEKRLRDRVRIFKERARYADSWAKRADAAETRWKRWVDDGPPPDPVSDQQITVRLRGGDSARRVLDLRSISIDGLVSTFSEEIHFGERIGVIGPNGSGKTHLIRLLAGEPVAHDGEVVVGPRVSAGLVHPAQRPTRFRAAPAARHSGRAPQRRWRPPCARSPATASPTPPTAATRPSRGAKRRASRSSASKPKATTCCCSTSPPTTWTSIPPRRSSRRSTASRAPSSPCPTTARSWAAWTAFS